MSGKRNQDRQRPHRRLERMLIYILFILALGGLVGAAFISPRWVFGIQDGIQCQEMVLEERENVDVTALSTNYEVSFYRRMTNFAENPPDIVNYYVTSEELTDYQELQRFLQSESGLYRDNILMLTEMGLITQDIFTSNISSWKQYVIYSDDYTRGVNFILWYIELESAYESTGTFKLLLEAETGDVYGVQADTGDLWVEGYEKGVDKTVISLEEFLGMSNYSDYYYSWETIAYYFSGMNETDYYSDYKQYLEQSRFYEDAIYAEKAAQEMMDGVEQNSVSIGTESNLWTGDSLVDYWMEHPPRFISRNNGNRLECTFPYGKSDMVFRIETKDSVPYPWILHDITVGFPAVYELIPEFG